jgi:catechol 2,3-dioxygenase
MIHTERIGHIVIKVRELERSRKFYTDVLGLTETMVMKEAKMAFFASNARDHHEIAVAEVGADAAGPQVKQVGLFHIAFRLRNEGELRAAYEELKAKKVPITWTVDHGITKSVYFRDPDGNQLELYCDNTPEYIAEFLKHPHASMERLDFAQDSPGFRTFTDTVDKERVAK